MNENFGTDDSGRISYFCGCSSPSGFYSCFDSVYSPEKGDTLYIIKGGPGTGKSTAMKKIATAAESEGHNVEYINCSSDPVSLDGIRIPALKTAMVDGTAPHVMDPRYPGVCERLVSFADCFDCNYLGTHREKLLALFRENAELHKRAGRFITAAGALLYDNFLLSYECSLPPKIDAFCKRTSMALFGETEENENDDEIIPLHRKMILSAVTPDGFVSKVATLNKMCDRVIAIEDEYGFVAGAIMNKIADAAWSAGHEVIICPCPLAPETRVDHIIIPAISTAFTVKNSYIRPDDTSGRIIHSARFTDVKTLRENRAKTAFNKRAADELIRNAAELLADARIVHDAIERYYVDAMDFSQVNMITERIKNEILR